MLIINQTFMPNLIKSPKNPPTFTNYLNARQIQNLLKNIMIQLFLKLHIWHLKYCSTTMHTFFLVKSNKSRILARSHVTGQYNCERIQRNGGVHYPCYSLIISKVVGIIINILRY